MVRGKSRAEISVELLASPMGSFPMGGGGGRTNPRGGRLLARPPGDYSAQTSSGRSPAAVSLDDIWRDETFASLPFDAPLDSILSGQPQCDQPKRPPSATRPRRFDGGGSGGHLCATGVVSHTSFKSATRLRCLKRDPSTLCDHGGIGNSSSTVCAKL